MTHWLDFLKVQKNTYPTPDNIPQILSVEAKTIWIKKLSDSYNIKLLSSMTIEEAWRMAWILVFEEVTGEGSPMVARDLTSNIGRNRLALNISRTRSSLANALNKVALFDHVQYGSSVIIPEVDLETGLQFNTVLSCKYRKDVEKYQLVDLLQKANFAKVGSMFTMKNSPPSVTVKVDLTAFNSVTIYYSQTFSADEYLPASMFTPTPNVDRYLHEVLSVYKKAILSANIKGIPLMVKV